MYDPGMDRPPDRWVSPEYDPGFPEIGGEVPPPEDVENPVGDVIFADANEQHRESIAAIGKIDASMRRLIEAVTDVGKETIRIAAGATMSQRIRFRLRYLIISRATQGVATFTVGTGSYDFDAPAAPVRVDLPLVIERGTDLGFTGDGRVYLVGDPE